MHVSKNGSTEWTANFVATVADAHNMLNNNPSSISIINNINQVFPAPKIVICVTCN